MGEEARRAGHRHRHRLRQTAPVSTCFVKRRDPATPGSIPDVLQMFTREVRFYREVAPIVGVRVPDCFHAKESDNGSTYLELEDLSDWQAGADPLAGAKALRDLHLRWQGRAKRSWPWLPRPDVSVLVEQLFDEEWARTRQRRDLTSPARELGDKLLGRAAEAERNVGTLGPETLVHGDASSSNMRTSATGVVALLDWEDFGLGPGISDLAWFLISSVSPEHWNSSIEAYGGSDNSLDRVLPAAAVQALLTLGGEDEGSQSAADWIDRVTEAARRL